MKNIYLKTNLLHNICDRRDDVNLKWYKTAVPCFI